MIDSRVLADAGRYREAFRNARPFPHVVIDDFFEPRNAAQLAADFPAFHPDNARNEFGGVGKKAVVTNISRISPFYARVHDHIGSPEFLDLMSGITGIPDLIHDAGMFGGGTHENLEGQELDPHVDFNFLEGPRLHRRLNLLVYLNAEWDESWGGSLELHSNPRRPREDEIKTILPLLNRAVLFETSERSWHGFERIHFPEGRKHLSRRALSIYLYTRERPSGDVVPPHGTFYVQRPLPPRFRAGRTLTEEDAWLIEYMNTRRDGWIEYYQNKELEDSRRLQESLAVISALRDRVSELESAAPEPVLEGRGQRAPRVPLNGPGAQRGAARGYWDDGWLAGSFEIEIRIDADVEGVELAGYLPDGLGPRRLEIAAKGRREVRQVDPGKFALRLPCHCRAGESLRLAVGSDRTHCPARDGSGADLRELSVLLTGVRLIPRN